MKRTVISLMLFTWAAGLLMLCRSAFPPTATAAPEVPTKQQRWEYATLIIGDNSVPQVIWQTGKTTFTNAQQNRSENSTLGINELYRKLGGQRDTATLGMLLDQIGHEGWELACYCRSAERGSQIWDFKRPAQ